MPIQHDIPRRIGLPPFFTSLMISVFNPMAAIAMIMQNLDNSLNGLKNEVGTPMLRAMVVMILANTKNRIKNGKIFLIEKFSPVLAWEVLDLMYASDKVIGMMASVRVNLTVIALSRVWLPRWWMASQVVATAVTDDVSLTAVPEKIPNASPLAVVKPRITPRLGNNSAAMTLKKKMTEMDCATSSSFASIIGAVAAIAEPPHMEEPTPIKVAILEGICRYFAAINAINNEMEIVSKMMGKDCFPVRIITLRFIPKPSSITAYCRIFFEVNRMPLTKGALFLINRLRVIPSKMAMTGPPIMGKYLPRMTQGIVISRHRKIPKKFCFKNDIVFLHLQYKYFVYSIAYWKSLVKLKLAG